MTHPFNGIFLTQKKGKVQQLQCENLKLLNEGCIASKVYMNKQNLKSPDLGLSGKGYSTYTNIFYGTDES